MIRYLDAVAVAALIRAIGLDSTFHTLADTIAEDFRRWPDFVKCARLAHHAPQGVVELMPIGDGSRFGFKYVNGHPGNTALGLATVVAFGVLADVATGLPLLLCDMTLLTALRTAATSALAAKHMSRTDSTIMVLIGCGAQSEFQITAFAAICGVKQFRVFDIDPAAVAKLQRNLADRADIEITAGSSVADTVRGADIVTTAIAAKAHASILTPEIVRSGMHINAIGGDCPGKTELDPALLTKARIAIEYEPQSRIEGEIQRAGQGAEIVEFWRILTGELPGRTHDDQITIFDSVGFALEDFSALRWTLDRAERHGVGTQMEMLPALTNPKDLFGFLKL